MVEHPTLVHFLKASVDRDPAAEVIVQGDSRVTYRELWRAASGVATFLAKQKIALGDRVAIFLPNSYEYVAAYYGVLMAGGAVVPLNTEAKSKDILNWVNHSGANVLIVLAGHQEFSHICSECDSELAIVAVGESSAEVETQNEIYAWDEACVAVEGFDELGHLEDVTRLATIIYTSGTTGEPKGVMLSHRNLASNTQSIVQYLGLTAEDRVLCVLPFYYSYGNSLLHTHVAVGGCLVLENNMMYPNLILQQMSDERVTGFSGVPTTYSMLLGAKNIDQCDFSVLRYMTQAGGAMPPANISRVRSQFPQVDFVVMYGQTEATARLSYLPPERLEEKLGSVGIAIPGVELKVCDSHGDPVAVGVTGEIYARGENLMMGYWKNPAATEAVFSDGWLKTGDNAHLDSDDYLFIDGRSSDFIKSGAHRISPKEIEEVIYELKGVREVAVVPVPDDLLGSVIKAVVVPDVKEDVSERDVKAYCLQSLARYKIPKFVVFADELPKTASGKIKKYLLVE